MTETQFQDVLREVIEREPETQADAWVEGASVEELPLAGDLDVGEFHIASYAEAGVMTRNAGLVVTLPDGSEFQLTIVQSRLVA